MQHNLEHIHQLIDLTTGDEKHDSSTHSTLDVLWVLYDRVLRFDPKNPRWDGRDRFVLSKGHGPISYYAILADKGFFPQNELRHFAKWSSILGSHPDRNKIPGVETSTGSLGHGLPMATGMALGLRSKKSSSRVFALIGDGESNEGSIWEAALVAGNEQLNNLTCILINNYSSTPNPGNLAEKFATFGWATTTINGRNHDEIYQALSFKDVIHPTLIVAEIKARMEAA